jgi:hypothetical protein
MKRNLEATKLLLRALVGASIDFDEVLQRVGEVRTALEGIEGDKEDVNEFLQFIDSVMNDLRKKRTVMDEIRRKGETIIWKRQVVSPSFKRPITDLELSDAAALLIPSGVETIGELCQYSPSELGPAGSCYVHEIKDVLGLPVLVLKPEE